MQKNWKELIRPDFVEKDILNDNHVVFIAKNLVRGFGLTLGNALRRVLLSSIRGYAIYALKIPNVEHEFSGIDGVSEDIMDIIINLKSVEVWLDSDKDYIASINVEGPKKITAADIQGDSSLRVLNKDQVICNVEKGKKFSMDLYVGSGRGFLSSDEVKSVFDIPKNAIAIDASFSPIKKVVYEVLDMRIGDKSDYNKLKMEIITNGAISPEDSLSISAKILKDQLSSFINFQEEDQDVVMHEQEELAEIDRKNKIQDSLSKQVEELDLSVRAFNCLKALDITNVKDLVSKGELEILSTKNFGRKTLNEIKDVLADLGLSLGMDLSDYE